MKITFVCLGNICRSPMAEYLAKNYLKNNKITNIKIDSCGIANYHEGNFMHRGTDRILTKLGIDHFDFKSKPITTKIFNDSDYVLVMDNSNLNDLIRKFGNSSKIMKITNFCTLNYTEVPDPYYTNNFEQTYEILINCISNFFDEIKIN